MSRAQDIRAAQELLDREWEREQAELRVDERAPAATPAADDPARCATAYDTNFQHVFTMGKQRRCWYCSKTRAEVDGARTTD
jgi:hypothetical protein